MGKKIRRRIMNSQNTNQDQQQTQQGQQAQAAQDQVAQAAPAAQQEAAPATQSRVSLAQICGGVTILVGIFMIITGWKYAVNSAYNDGFNSGRKAGIEQVEKGFSEAPWYQRLYSAFSGEIPRK